MLDIFNIPDTAIQNQVFYTKGTLDWQTWFKPNNARFVSILCIGAGGGGGAGGNGAGSTTRQGGGGGGAGGISYGFFPANQIPEILFVQPGAGGTGGVGGTSPGSGSSGALSYVSCQPNTTNINVLLQSGLAGATGGNTGQIGGGQGVASTVWTGNPLNIFATATAGQNGSPGTTAGTPGAITLTKIVTGGAGGAGYSAGVNTGGSITGSAFVPTISGGGGNINANGVDGSGGYTSLTITPNSISRQPVFFTGGAGGGSSNNYTGGTGGNASFGCGGGGGGCGSTSGGVGANGAGAGGKGGDGIIIITCY